MELIVNNPPTNNYQVYLDALVLILVANFWCYWIQTSPKYLEDLSWCISMFIIKKCSTWFAVVVAISFECTFEAKVLVPFSVASVSSSCPLIVQILASFNLFQIQMTQSSIPFGELCLQCTVSCQCHSVQVFFFVASSSSTVGKRGQETRMQIQAKKQGCKYRRPSKVFFHQLSLCVRVRVHPRRM